MLLACTVIDTRSDKIHVEATLNYPEAYNFVFELREAFEP